MSIDKKCKFRLTNGSIWVIFFIVWFTAIALTSALTANICRNYSASFCEVFLWIGKAINILIAFNLMAMAEISTTSVKTKAKTHKPLTFSKYELLYETHVKNIASQTSFLDNLFKKTSLSGMCRPGLYFGFLLLKYLK